MHSHFVGCQMCPTCSFNTDLILCTRLMQLLKLNKEKLVIWINQRKLDIRYNWQCVGFCPKERGTMKAVVIWLLSNFSPLQYSTNNVSSCVSFHTGELTVSQLVKIFPTIYKAQRFVTICSTACHLSFCWLRLIKTTPSHPVCLRYISILPSMCYSTNGTV